MTNLFIDMLNKGVMVFSDDILIDSNTMENSFNYLKKVFTCLYKNAFYSKLKKCSNLWNMNISLGFNITLEGIHISDAKLRSLKE